MGTLEATKRVGPNGGADEERVWGLECFGGLLLIGGKGYYFSVLATPAWDAWMGPRVKGERLAQRINIAEGVPMVLALGEPTMRSELAGGVDLSVYIDNAAAELVLRRPPAAPRKETAVYLYGITAEVWRRAREMDLRIWVHRVPSACNPAHPFSRGDLSARREAGWTEVHPRMPKYQELWWVRDLLLRSVGIFQ